MIFKMGGYKNYPLFRYIFGLDSEINLQSQLHFKIYEIKHQGTKSRSGKQLTYPYTSEIKQTHQVRNPKADRHFIYM